MTTVGIESKLAKLLKPRRFNKRRNIWTRHYTDLLQVLELKVSGSCDEGYYIDLGIYIKEFGYLIRPPLSKCHIRYRPQRSDVHTMIEESLRWFDQMTTLQEVSEVIGSLEPQCMIDYMVTQYFERTKLQRLQRVSG